MREHVLRSGIVHHPVSTTVGGKPARRNHLGAIEAVGVQAAHEMIAQYGRFAFVLTVSLSAGFQIDEFRFLGSGNFFGRQILTEVLDLVLAVPHIDERFSGCRVKFFEQPHGRFGPC